MHRSDLRRWLLTHDYWLAGNLVTTPEAAALASADIGRSVTRRQVALMAGKICDWWPKTCRRMIQTSRRPVNLSALQWERVMIAVRGAIEDSTAIQSAAQVARMVRGKYAVTVVLEALKSCGFDREMALRDKKPEFALDI